MLYTVLCVVQLAIGVLMFSFGIVDRTAIQVQFSFLMLPIWIGILAGLTGLFGVLIGLRNKRQGYPNVNMVSAIRAINTLCVGLSLILFYMYGTVQSYFGLRDAYNTAIENLPDDDPARKKYFPIPALSIPIDVVTDSDTIQGVLAAIMILCLAEMFVGCWMAMLDKDQMMLRSQSQQNARRLFDNPASNPYQPQVSHVTAPHQEPPKQMPYGSGVVNQAM